jgi:hypothetical protein
MTLAPNLITHFIFDPKFAQPVGAHFRGDGAKSSTDFQLFVIKFLPKIFVLMILWLIVDFFTIDEFFGLTY